MFHGKHPFQSPLSRGEGAPKGGGSGMRVEMLDMVRRNRLSKT